MEKKYEMLIKQYKKETGKGAVGYRGVYLKAFVEWLMKGEIVVIYAK